MPQLLKNIEAYKINNITGNTSVIKNVLADIGTEDYINLNGFKAYIQDLTNVEFSSSFDIPPIFGLKNERSLEMKTLILDYQIINKNPSIHGGGNSK